MIIQQLVSAPAHTQLSAEKYEFYSTKNVAFMVIWKALCLWTNCSCYFRKDNAIEDFRKLIVTNPASCWRNYFIRQEIQNQLMPMQSLIWFWWWEIPNWRKFLLTVRFKLNSIKKTLNFLQGILQSK
jgi:hypothetical protein